MGRTQAEREATGNLAEEIYVNQLRAQVETEENIGRIITIDTKTGDYEIDADHMKAVSRLRARRPDAETFSFRIGYDAVYAIGRTLQRTVP